jgi:hypothetical protein
LISEDSFLVCLDPLLVAEHLIQLPLVAEDASLIRLDLLLIFQNLIELSLVREQPHLVPQDFRLIGKYLTFTHDSLLMLGRPGLRY